MKNIVLSAVAVCAMSSFSMAGGDVAPIVPVSEEVDNSSLANDMEGLYWNGAHDIDADAITIGVNYLF